MKIRPLDDRVLIKIVEFEDKTAGGIFLPDTAKEKSNRGEVIAVGPGRVTDDGNRTALEVKVGAKVYFSKYAGTEIKTGDEKFLLVREDDILAVIED